MAMTTRRLVLVGTAAALLASSTALAFRPSAGWLFGQAAERSRSRGSNTLTVEATTTIYDEKGRAIVAAAPERLILAWPGKLRRELEVDGGATLEVRADGKLTTQQPGAAAKSGRAGVDLLAEMMTSSSSMDINGTARGLLNGVKALGVNPEIVAYGRFDGRVAFLIGSKPWETDKSQVWLDKDLLVPLRVVSTAGGVVVDIRYLGWGSPVGGSWYPQVVEIWQDGRLVRRTVTENLERNTAVAAATFSP